MYRIRRVKSPEEVAALTFLHSDQSDVDPFEWVKQGNLGLVAETGDGFPVGALLLVADRRVASSVISFRLAWLLVDEAYRRQGIARSLLQSAFRDAIKAGVRCIHVAINPNNEPCVALFSGLDLHGNCGFAIQLTHRAYRGA